MGSRTAMATDTTSCCEASEQSPYAFADLFTRPTAQRLSATAVLFREGETPAGVYILHSGEVALTHANTDGAARERIALAGEILGLADVISGCAHVATAVAKTPCEVGFIEREVFRSLVDDSPAIWFSVLRQLSLDVNATYAVIRNRVRRDSGRSSNSPQ
jgi:CRP-like cAMP-binding protein